LHLHVAVNLQAVYASSDFFHAFFLDKVEAPVTDTLSNSTYFEVETHEIIFYTLTIENHEFSKKNYNMYEHAVNL